MSNPGRMEGRRVLVSGSQTGIGRGVAVEFARAGADVAVHYPFEALAGDAAETVAAIRALGRKAEAFRADFNDVAQVQKLGAQAAEFLGGLDVLVNNSGITLTQPFEQTTVEQFDTVYNVNIRGMFFLTQAAVKPMIAQGRGHVINLASVHAYFAMTEHTVYAGTKAAITAFTRVLALEMIPKGVRVNCIAPGGIIVEKLGRDMLMTEEDLKQAAHHTPAGFVGLPSDIGQLAIFLASDESRYIVGQTLICDGGQSAIMPLTGDFREPREYRGSGGYVPGA